MPSISQPSKITPFLWFDGNAEEAVRFYTSIFPDSRIGTITRYGPNMHQPAGTVLTIEFELAGVKFTAMNGGPGFPFNESVSFVVNCEDQAEIDRYWEKLTGGGGRPVQCSWLKDRFGLSWQIVPKVLWEWFKDQETMNRVMQEVMKMVKLDLAQLKAAAEGR